MWRVCSMLELIEEKFDQRSLAEQAILLTLEPRAFLARLWELSGETFPANLLRNGQCYELVVQLKQTHQPAELRKEVCI